MRYAAIICAAAAAAVAAAPAGATVSERERYSEVETFTDAPCGYPLDVTFAYEGQAVTRDTKGGEAFRWRNTYSFRTVFTNPANGRWLVIRGHGTLNEVKARQVDGNLYEFVRNEAGQLLVLEDADGNVLVRDRGLVRSTFLFDTLGDGMPGGELVGEEAYELHGRFPTWDENFPFCEIFDGELS